MIKVSPQVSDIMTVDLLYYDESKAADCYSFCEKRDIDCLPVIGDTSHFYRRNDGNKGMERRRLTADRRLNAHTPLFQPDLLDRFRRQHVMFIFDCGEMTGVVHFSDYNKSFVSAYLYTQIAAYEQSLRELAEQNQLTSEMMLAYLDDMAVQTTGTDDYKYYNGRSKRFIKKAQRMPRAPKFQVFELRDLVGFVEAKGIIELDDDVVELRNAVMHANQMVDKVDPDTEDFIYDFETFKTFFMRVQVLLNDSQRVRNRLQIAHLIKSISEER